jgi:hypothetical protein
MSDSPQPVRAWLSDMDGVLVHEDVAIPGAADFVRKLRDCGLPFLLLTNNSIFTARDLQARLSRSGIDVPEEAIWTSALATAQFLDKQRPGGTAYVIGEAGLTTAMHAIGYVRPNATPSTSSSVRPAPTPSRPSPPRSASSRTAPASSLPTPTPPARRSTGPSPPLAPSPPSSPEPPESRPTSSASRTP